MSENSSSAYKFRTQTPPPHFTAQQPADLFDRLEIATNDRQMKQANRAPLAVNPGGDVGSQFDVRSAPVTNAAVGMPCPVCKIALTMSERQGVEIDYCPQCRGVWLDRGELDKILERSASEAQQAAPPKAPYPQQPPLPAQQQPVYRRDYDDDYRKDQYGRPYQKRKKSFLEDLFD